MRKLFLFLLLTPLMVLAQDDSKVLSLSDISVKVGHEWQISEGIKMYKKCYKENNGEDSWNVWWRVQGKNSQLTFTSMYDNWAGMDSKDDEADSKCRNIVTKFFMPHVSSYENSIATTMPKVSKDDNNTLGKVWVTSFKVNNGKEFMDVINSVSEAIKSTEGDERAYWYSFAGGGPESADYMVVWPFDKYADLDKDEDSVWKVVEKKHGKKKLKELQAKFRKSVDNSWSYIYERSEDLGYSKE